MRASPFPPVKLMSFAIQALPGLARREYLLITAVALWACTPSSPA